MSNRLLGSKTPLDSGWSIKNRHQHRRSFVWVLVGGLGRGAPNGGIYRSISKSGAYELHVPNLTVNSVNNAAKLNKKVTTSLTKIGITPKLILVNFSSKSSIIMYKLPRA